MMSLTRGGSRLRVGEALIWKNRLLSAPHHISCILTVTKGYCEDEQWHIRSFGGYHKWMARSTVELNSLCADSDHDPRDKGGGGQRRRGRGG